LVLSFYRFCLVFRVLEGCRRRAGLGGLRVRLARAATRALRRVEGLGGQLRAVVVQLVLGVGEDVQIGRIGHNPVLLIAVGGGRGAEYSQLGRMGLRVHGNADHLHVLAVLHSPVDREALRGHRQEQRLQVVATGLLHLGTQLAVGKLIAGTVSGQAEVRLAVHLGLTEVDDGGVLAERKADGVHLRKNGREESLGRLRSLSVGSSATAYFFTTLFGVKGQMAFNFFRQAPLSVRRRSRKFDQI
jgi:hypothetical protein